METTSLTALIQKEYEQANYNYSVRTNKVMWTHFQLWLNAVLSVQPEQYETLDSETKVKILETYLKDTVVPQRGNRGISQ